MLRHWSALLVLLALLPLAHAASEDHNQQTALFVLNRLGYGPAAGDVTRVTELGARDWIAAQLQPEGIALPAETARDFAALAQRQRQALSRLSELASAGRPDTAEKERRQALRREIFREIAEADLDCRLQHALRSPRQLEELMTEFWFNHFNVYSGKAEVRALAGAYEREAIRPHVLGRFRDLLGATAKHPAMLFYLDNWQSAASGSRRSEDSGLNENYARELMELHTLGVDGGYTQQDVTELARMLTGWTYDRRALVSPESAFRFNPRWHDTGSKRWLGETISNQGLLEGEHALDVLARSPATAQHISRELAQFFVSDTPPPALVSRLARRFQNSDGNIREVLQTLFASPEFWQSARTPRFKTPYRYVISALRLQGITQPPARPVQAALLQMGQGIYGWPTPDGYKVSESAWLNPLAMQQRLDFATQAGLGRLDREAELANPERMQAEITPLLGVNTLQVIRSSPPALQPVLLLASPEFMHY
ncbi:DUF1800 domain-containing protein [Chitinilyticum piscinae]|uniref:DUF1800 domain-containing protein n=1 Tax=Chitinilyticum piscinae TaxID=2866724 RepID=A0A8J7FL37_9NEIS|nr:DUF1800 domain-containing protein [Chitinilyticum piscinae]MBE9608384.1 DUF1800 domain-containing protein [Chitinilyticum piscinae]